MFTCIILITIVLKDTPVTNDPRNHNNCKYSTSYTKYQRFLISNSAEMKTRVT